MDYKDIIRKVFTDLCGPPDFIDDPNVVIDARLGDKKINWYPYLLFICNGQFFMFLPFSSESFIDESEIREECKNAQHLVSCFKKEGISSKVFYITNKNEDVEALKRLDLSGSFGILHNELERPLLDFSITDIFKAKCRLFPNVLKYLSNCKNIKGEIGNLIRKFSKRYLEGKPEGDRENEMIKEFMERMLACDERLRLGTEPINFMAEIEKIVTITEAGLREHFFHAFNTMMLGFVIIDKLYDEFDVLTKKYADDIVLELIWILTSLYHDVGYPVLLYYYLTCETFGLERESNRALIDNCVKQNRQDFWDIADYRLIVEALNNLFSHITSSRAGRWVFDGFPRSIKPTKFKNGMKSAFVEKGTHGAAGALKLALLANKHIKDVEKNKEREFLYRHTMLASMSILFHDSKVRDCFRKKSIRRIRTSEFPFSGLLTYVDILQDDRRNPTGSSSRPDIFKGVDIVEGKTIVAKLEEEPLSEGVRRKLFEELKEALSFFIMNGLTFAIPEELLTKKA